MRVATVPSPPRAADGRIDLDQLVERLRRFGPVDVLESAPDSVGARRWSYAVPAPRASLVADSTSVRFVRSDGPTTPLGTDVFTALDRIGARTGLRPDAPRDPALPPLSGGLVGALSYDVARPAPGPGRARADRRHLLAHLALAEVVVATDGEMALVLERPLLDGDPSPGRGHVLDALRGDVSLPPRMRGPGRQVAVTTLPTGRYHEVVRRVLEHIAAGDVFQTNVTHRVTARWTADVHSLYRALRRRSPAPHGAVIERCGIASISPETFLLAEGRDVTVRPIKGTRPRSPDPHADARAAEELRSSDKDRAENVMVVDMERNDLGRVCRPGTVRVPELLSVEAHPTVWHLVSTVRGRLEAGTGWGGLLRATFPCGSVTGTPKIRAMELIDELEPVRRSWYCGTIGFLASGAADTLVAIRTAVLGDGLADYGTGGGIVAGSDPDREHAESLDKAAAFLAATGAVMPPSRRRAPAR